MDHTLSRAIEGFASAEEHPGIPSGWNVPVAEAGADLAQFFSAVDGSGLLLELVEQGEAVRRAVVTRATAQNLSAGVRLRARSIGSAIGRIETATLRQRREASLWLERTDKRVAIAFEARDVDTIRAAWGRRVEVRGVLERDHDGQLVRVRMRQLDILAEQTDSPALSDLIGLDPGLTGGSEPGDYLRGIRGEAQ
jgi:hypothetical protein